MQINYLCAQRFNKVEERIAVSSKITHRTFYRVALPSCSIPTQHRKQTFWSIAIRCVYVCLYCVRQTIFCSDSWPLIVWSRWQFVCVRTLGWRSMVRKRGFSFVPSLMEFVKCKSTRKSFQFLLIDAVDMVHRHKLFRFNPIFNIGINVCKVYGLMIRRIGVDCITDRSWFGNVSERMCQPYFRCEWTTHERP